MPESDNHSRTYRRTLMKGVGGATGLTAMAGCFENSGTSSSDSVPGADGEMIMTTSTETTTAYAMSQVIANSVSQNSNLEVQARPSEGTNANIGRLQRNEIDIAYIQNWTASKIANEEAPFEDLDYKPYQVFHLYDLAWFFCTANDGWTSITDIGSGDRVSPTPRGAGTAEMLEYALSFVTEDYKRVSFNFGSQGSAMSEDRLDVGMGALVNGVVQPGWLNQLKGTVGLRMLQWPDDIVSTLEEDPSILMTTVDTTGFDNYEYAPDMLNTPALSYNFVVRDNFSDETLKTFLETLWKQREGLEESHALLGPLAEGDHWLKNSYTTLPFHPAAAEFYQEKGVWNDEYEIGE